MENILIWFIKNKTYVLGKDMKNCLFYGDKSLIFLLFIVFVSTVSGLVCSVLLKRLSRKAKHVKEQRLCTDLAEHSK